jgi:rsbT co-antagonist protein RsbR
MDPASHGHFGMTSVRGTVVVTVTQDLGDDAAAAIQSAVLDAVHAQGARRVVLDLTAVPFLDLREFDALRRISRAAGLMGASTTMVGLGTGIILHLVEQGADTSGIHAAAGLAEALEPASGDANGG